jgi:hypothetical protein
MRLLPDIAFTDEISCCIARRCGKFIAYFSPELAWIEPFTKMRDMHLEAFKTASARVDYRAD